MPQQINTDFLPDATGRDLGSLTQRWDGFFQSLDVQRSNGIRMAESFTGADAGLKIAAAFSDLGSTPGEVWVTQAAGLTQWSNVNIPAGGILRFLQGGTYNIGRITLGNGACVVGQPSAMFDGTTNYIPVVLRSNVSSGGAITVSGQGCVVEDFLLDGLNATSTAVGIKVTGKRSELSRIAVWRFPSDNLQFVSTSTNNEAGEPKLFKVFSIASSGHNLSATNTADGFVSNCEFENAAATKYGINLTASSTWRIEHCDIGGNGAGGINITGLSTSPLLNGGFTQVVGCDFGNNLGSDVTLNGWDSVNAAPSSAGNVFAANTHAGLGSTATDNTYSAYKITDSTGNSVTGNTILSITSHRYKYGVEESFASLTPSANTFTGNSVNGVVGTAAYLFTSTAITAANTDFSNGFGLLRNAYLANADTFSVKNAAGTVQSIWTPLNASNDSIFNNGNVGKSHIFKVNSVTGLTVNGGSITIPAFVLNGSQSLTGVTGNGASLMTSTLPMVTGIQYPRTNITLVNGANSDIALSGTTFAKVVGPTGVFSVSGFAAGTDGRVLILYNSVAFAMTITNNATSSAANRILTLTGADVVLRAGQSSATFVYDSAQNLWILVSTN